MGFELGVFFFFFFAGEEGISIESFSPCGGRNISLTSEALLMC